MITSNPVRNHGRPRGDARRNRGTLLQLQAHRPRAGRLPLVADAVAEGPNYLFNKLEGSGIFAYHEADGWAGSVKERGGTKAGRTFPAV